ncbi:hypothetical protein V8E54_014380 [Elaphomyces granulatus]
MDSSLHPKRLVFAPGDANGPNTQDTTMTANTQISDLLRSETATPTSASQQELFSHPARAHQFIINPPLTLSQLHPTSPLHQFHSWFRDPRLSPSSTPETCTLATASLPSGRVSARMVYLKELDERGWVVYSNWDSREGKGGQVFGRGLSSSDTSTTGAGEEPRFSETHAGDGNQGNKWVALTFFWQTVERQVRIEGLLELLSKEESETYWRTRERGSQIGAWASWQSKVLWSAEPGTGQSAIHCHENERTTEDAAEILDDGRAVLEQRVKDVEARFANTEEIPLPPWWGGARIVPESVEFWQGRRSRLHDRFRYVRTHGAGNGTDDPEDHHDEQFKWRIERLSP